MKKETESDKVELTPEEAAYFASRGQTTRFDNEGNMVISNRAARRKRPVVDPDFTKSTWSRQTKAELKRKRKLGRR